MTDLVPAGGDVIEPLYHPYKLRKDYLKRVNNICNDIKKGYRPKMACFRNGVTRDEFYNWRKYADEELEAGLSDTPCINFWNHIDKAEAESEAPLVDALRNAAIDGNVKGLTYLLDNRYGWKSDKSDIEINNNSSGNIQINIVDMVNPYKEGE